MTKPKQLHVYRVWATKNLFYSVYVQAENAQQAESALECDAWSKVNPDVEEFEDEIFKIEEVSESECSLEDVDIRHVDIIGQNDE